MVTGLLILCLLVWLPLFLYQIIQRRFSVLLIWLFIAPVASNLVNYSSSNPILGPEGKETTSEDRLEYFDEDNSVRLQQFLEPTRALVAIMFTVFLLEAFLRKGLLKPLDRTEIYMGCFSIVMLMGVVLYSSRLQYGLRVTVDAFIAPFLVYYICRRLVINRERLYQVIKVIGYMGLYVIIISLIERLMHAELLYRLDGPFRMGSTLHVVMSVVFFIALADLLSSLTLPAKPQVLPRSIQWSVVSLAPVVLFLTLSRGNWAGFLLGVWVFLFLGRRLINPSWKVGAIGLTLVIIPLLVIGMLALIPEEIIDRRLKDANTIYGRFATWQIAIQEGFKRPIIGIGLNNLRDVFAEVQRRVGGVGNFLSVHNSFLAFFAEQGALGLLMYFAIVASICRTGRRLYRTGRSAQERWWGVAVIAMMVAYLAPAMFAATLHINLLLQHLFVYAFVGSIAGLYGHSRPYSNPYVLRQPATVGYGK